MTADLRRFAPATERNRDFILPTLQRILPEGGTVLEIGSGTGEHAVHFASRLPAVVWQPSDRNENSLASIAAWVRHADLPNLRKPIALDVTQANWAVDNIDAMVCINVIHYSPWSSTPALFSGASRVLHPGGVLYCYGPYRRGGAHTASSNEQFDAWLKGIDRSFGVRDLETVQACAAEHGLRLDEVIDMPANNLGLVFRKD